MRERLDWKDKGPTPLGNKGYTPQGITWVDNKIIFANTWKNKRSRVYEIDPQTMTILRHFDMPPEAVHTSGLAWDGQYLWGVDHISNLAYCIDLELSLSKQEVHVIGSFDTTLKGTSACCIVEWKDNRYLAISDFMKTRRTIFVRIPQALKAGTAKSAIDFEYINEGFSQGLEFVNGFLLESENKIGKDIVNKIDMDKLNKFHNSRKAAIQQYDAPGSGVEDLAWDGSSLWTSDEYLFRFFKASLE